MDRAIVAKAESLMKRPGVPHDLDPFNSIVDLIYVLDGEPKTFGDRKAMAEELGIGHYAGSAGQNRELITKVREWLREPRNFDEAFGTDGW